MAQLTSPCTCGGTEVFAFGQHLSGRELVWWGSTRCDACGSQTEFDDYGDLPDDLKQIMLQDEGEWELAVAPGENVVSAMKVVRERLDVSLSEARVALGQLRGTKTTLEWIQLGFTEAGIHSSLRLME